jgi:hypothetical protein
MRRSKNSSSAISDGGAGLEKGSALFLHGLVQERGLYETAIVAKAIAAVVAWPEAVPSGRTSPIAWSSTFCSGESIGRSVSMLLCISPAIRRVPLRV